VLKLFGVSGYSSTVPVIKFEDVTPINSNLALFSATARRNKMNIDAVDKRTSRMQIHLNI